MKKYPKPTTWGMRLISSVYPPTAVVVIIIFILNLDSIDRHVLIPWLILSILVVPYVLYLLLGLIHFFKSSTHSLRVKSHDRDIRWIRIPLFIYFEVFLFPDGKKHQIGVPIIGVSDKILWPSYNEGDIVTLKYRGPIALSVEKVGTPSKAHVVTKPSPSPPQKLSGKAPIKPVPKNKPAPKRTMPKKTK